MRAHLLLAALIAPALGCRSDGDDLKAIPVASAWLEDANLASVAIVGGVVTGEGVLVVVTPSGDEHAWPVRLSGSEWGAVIDLAGTVDFGGKAELDLSEVSGPITGNTLLGRYHGSSASAVVGLGVDAHTLRNRDGVRLDKDWFALGVSIFGGAEWLGIHLDDDADADELDTGG